MPNGVLHAHIRGPKGMNSVNLPNDTKLAGKIIAAQALHDDKRIEHGVLGRIFGGKHGAPTNIACFVIVTAVVMLCIVALTLKDQPSFSKKDGVSLFSGLITLGLGYLFGRGSKD